MDVELLLRAIDHFGAEKQIMKAIEEMAELTTELARFRNNRGMAINILEELADVSIMVEQMCLIFGKELVENHIAIKQRRLRLMIDTPDEDEPKVG